MAPGEPVWGLDPRDRASRVLDDIARHHQDAVVLIEGERTVVAMDAPLDRRPAPA